MTDLRTAAARATGSTQPGDSRRTIERRRSLPGGRAVVGAFLIAAAAVGVFAAYLDAVGGPATRYVVAARAVPVGTQLTAADLTTVPLDLPPEQRSRAFDDPSVLEGATVIGPLEPHELVQSSMVVATQPGQVEEISFALDVDRAVAGRLLPGERVDLLATYGTGDRAYTVAVVRDALVVQMDRDTAGTLGATGQAVLSLAVADAEHSLAIAHAVDAGTVTVVRASGLDRPGDLPDSFRPQPVADPAGPPPQTAPPEAAGPEAG